MKNADEIDSYITVPEGTYTVRVAEVRLGPPNPHRSLRTLSMRLEIARGRYRGRTAAWTRILWPCRLDRGAPAPIRALYPEGMPNPDSLPGGDPTPLLHNRTARVRFEVVERQDFLTKRPTRFLDAAYFKPDPRRET